MQGISGGTDVSTLKHSLSQVFTGHFGFLASGLSVFTVLVGSAGNGSSQTAGAYQLFLAIIASLAVIWALRQVLAGASPRIRDAYYRGMYPLIPFILVLLVIGLQLIPLLIGSTLYSLVINNGIAVYFAIEKLVWALLYAAAGTVEPLHAEFVALRAVHRNPAGYDAYESPALGPRTGALPALDGTAQNPLPAGHFAGGGGGYHGADYYCADAAGAVGILPADDVLAGGRACLYVHAVPGAAE